MRKILFLPAAGAWLMNLNSFEKNACGGDLLDIGRAQVQSIFLSSRQQDSLAAKEFAKRRGDILADLETFPANGRPQGNPSLAQGKSKIRFHFFERLKGDLRQGPPPSRVDGRDDSAGMRHQDGKTIGRPDNQGAMR